jgi:CO/xanthine dehydrogenase FAD-binding subunit
MKPVDFDYERPASVAEVCRRLAEARGEAKIIAGGQTLVPLLAMRLARPALLLDISRIAALDFIAGRDGHVAIGAATRQSAAQAHDTVRAAVPLLAKALGFVGHVQTRNRGTIGGSLANADPAAEIGLAALALDAEVRASSVAGERAIALRDFFRGPMETALAADECLTELRLPVWREAGAVGSGFQEVSVRHSDFALAAAAVQLALDPGGICRRVAIAVGGADAIPQRAAAAEARILGTTLDERDLDEAAALVANALTPLADQHASPLYRRRVAATLVKRALAEARDEARAA